MELSLETIKKIIELSEIVYENASYLRYTVNPIGTFPNKSSIKEDVEIIRNLLNEIEAYYE